MVSSLEFLISILLITLMTVVALSDYDDPNPQQKKKGEK